MKKITRRVVGAASFSMCATLALSVACVLLPVLAGAEDWPTFRHDNGRSAITSERLAPPLVPQWVFKAPFPPKPAWPDPGKEKGRVHFDEVYHVAVAGEAAYFASSADGKVYCLDIGTGQVRWSAMTNGPIRVAPAIANGRVYVGSDDGCAYCFKSEDGALVWKTRASFGDDEVIGNGRMISLWPIRTGVLIDGGVAYFGAGVFPHESIFVCAAKADDGTILWRNDTCGEIGYTLEYGGISPQGALLATKSTLFVPSGRAMPAAFDKQTGQFSYYISPGGHVGGAWALLTTDRLIAGTDAKRAYDTKGGRIDNTAAYAWFPGLHLVVTDQFGYMLTFDELAALDRSAFAAANESRDRVLKEIKPLDDDVNRLQREARLATPEELPALHAQIAPLKEQIKELEAEQKRIETSVYRWHRACPHQNALILAGDTLYMGGDNAVAAAAVAAGDELWSAPVEGKASGLAVAGGRLFVSTDTGKIYCFGTSGPTHPAPERAVPANLKPYAEDERGAKLAKAADRIVSGLGQSRGYALVYGSGTGRLMFELALRTGLELVGIDPDAASVEAARKALDAAGLYGSRATILQGSLEHMPYADYFANLVVSENSLVSGQPVGSIREALRCLKPCGGAAYLNGPLSAYNDTELANWLKAQGFTCKEEDGWLKVVRGPLPGAGKWTHQYADPANTACSDDQVVKGQLGVLWFGDPGPEQMVERHARAAAPVARDGRMFVQGENVIMAHDSYNGMLLWQRDIPGAVRVRVDSDMGNLALEGDGLYVAAGNQCLRLDPATGATMKTYGVPAAANTPERWGYIACIGHTLFGSRARPLDKPYGAAWWEAKKGAAGGTPSAEDTAALLAESRPPNPRDFWSIEQGGSMWRSMTSWPAWGSVETPQGAVSENIMASDCLFALDTETGKTKWTYEGGPIAHPAIAIGDGTVFLADCRVTDEQKAAAMQERNALVEKGVWEKETITYEAKDADVRLVVALDAATGAKRWERVIDLTGCGGDRMGLAYNDGVLCFFGCFSNHDRDLFKFGKLAWRRVTALKGADGGDLWSRPLNYLRRPLIMADTILVEPRACDLRTGAVKTRMHPLTGAESTWEFVRPGHCCAITSACPNMFFLRGDYLWYYDMNRDQGMLPFGGIRPGCWINTIPANGLLLFPEASAGCTCSFPVRSSVALEPQSRQRTWSICIQHGEQKPVARMAILFGAPGDWRDDAGNMWFTYPHIRNTRWFEYGIDFALEEKFLKEPRYFSRNFRGLDIKNTDKPWIFASGCKGLVSCALPLLDEGQGPGVYTVRLYFADPENTEPGRRVFTVKLQDQGVLNDFDIVKDAGGPNTAVVKEIKGIKVAGALKVELVPKSNEPADNEAPLLNAIEVVREDVAVARAAS